MNRNLKNCLIAIVLLSILLGLLFTGIINDFDSYFASLIYHNSVLTKIFKTITFFGSTIGIIIICLSLLIWIRDYKKLIWLYSCLIVSTLVNNIVKVIVARPRPLLEHLVQENTYSFPSGHAMATCTLYGGIIYLIWQSKISKKAKIINTILLLSLVLIIGFSRLYLNVHHLSDVLGGFLFSIIILDIAILIDTRKQK